MHSNKDKSDAHEADGVKENSFQARMELPKHNSLDKKCKWVCPEFSPITGIGEGDLWTLKGLIVAIGFIDDQKQQVIGSGAMVAPGLCLTATHVLEGLWLTPSRTPPRLFPQTRPRSARVSSVQFSVSSGFRLSCRFLHPFRQIRELFVPFPFAVLPVRRCPARRRICGRPRLFSSSIHLRQGYGGQENAGHSHALV
jgi:hypothetical protein